MHRAQAVLCVALTAAFSCCFHHAADPSTASFVACPLPTANPTRRQSTAAPILLIRGSSTFGCIRPSNLLQQETRSRVRPQPAAPNANRRQRRWLHVPDVPHPDRNNRKTSRGRRLGHKLLRKETSSHRIRPPPAARQSAHRRQSRHPTIFRNPGR